MKATVKENFDEYLEAHGPLENLPWETMDGRKMKVGEMSDEHVENCITHHQKIIYDHGSEDDHWNPTIMSCRVIVMIMQEEQKRRAAL